MGKAFIFNCRIGVFCIVLAGLLLAGPAVCLADDTVCARVKIEIKQELTLERQAFDAHMRINNGLANISLQDVRVEVSFTDANSTPVPASSDPDQNEALFFIRLDSMENINNVSGTGMVAASTSADIHWLIIPAPGASNGLEKGTLYYVGAKLIYTIGGEEKVTEVTPDYIFVKPMPEITLDYFLPDEVYGDDPLTEGTVEPIVPFSLGVRVKNSGYGVARELKIESAQPRIIENKQGLLIGFAIEGSDVNGQPATDSLLADFGDISPNSAGVARWIMTCTLSGKFVSFTAEYSHSDELGGELTSLMGDVNHHFLVRDVQVDLPGRDTVRDFLAKDGDVYRIFESEVAGLADPEDEDPQVADQSGTAVLNGSGDMRTLTTALTAGYMVVRLTDPFGGQKVLSEVIRSDGKIIKPANAWLSHTRVKTGPWQYFFNLFDVNSTGAYTVRFEDTSAVPMPPTMQYIIDKTVAEGEQVSFIVEASDPNKTVPKLTATPLPTGAVFTDGGNGEGVFDWTPGTGQAGIYGIVFTASDGALSISRRATITVKGFHDTDGDDLDDDWEMQHFGTLARDGSGDFDRDGISDRDEFLNDTDPAGLADLALYQTVDNMSPAVGDEVLLTITATNSGLRDATGIQVTDLLSSGLTYISDDSNGRYDPATGIWDIGEVSADEPGNMATINITAEVMRSGRIVNIAALTDADLYDPDRSNNSTGLILNGGIQADLALAQTIDNPMPDADDTLAVTITVTNNGVDDATGVRIMDVLPSGLSYDNSTASQGQYNSDAGTWEVGELAAGAGATLQLMLTVDTINEIINTAVISGSDQTDPDPTNNRSSEVINRDPESHPAVADLAVYKLVNQTSVDVGEQVEFTLLVRNLGPDDAGAVEVDDMLPVGLTYLSSHASQGTYDEENGLWQVGVVPAGSYVVMDTLVEVNAAGQQTNTADIGSTAEFDADDGNDSAADSVTGLAADIAVTQSVDRTTANVGEAFVFTITVSNLGPCDAVGLQVVDELPSGLSYQSNDPPSQGIFDSDTGQWEIGELANGNSATLIIAARVETSGAMIKKVTLINSSPTDTVNGNNSAQVTLIGNAPPQAALVGSFGGDEGQAILFSGSASDIESAELTYQWDFDYYETFAADVSGVDLAAPQWTFNNNGSYTVALRVEDKDGGLSDIVTGQVTINDLAPAAAFTKSGTSVPEGSAVAFSDASTSYPDNISTWQWNFGDGTTGSDRNPSHVYNDNGIYTVGLVLTDDDGSRSFVEDTIIITNVAPTAMAGPDQAANEGDVVAFNGSFTDPGTDTHTIQWDFGDGSSMVDTLSPTHQFADNGTYAVTLKVTDDDGAAGTDTLNVIVNNVAPKISGGNDTTIDEGDIFTGSGDFADPGADTWSATVDFGDGSGAQPHSLNPDKSYHLNHKYVDDGIYTVRISVNDDDGAMDTDALIVTVNNVTPAVEAGDDQTAAEGAPVSFVGSFTDPGADTHGIQWDFGDGSIVSGILNPTHTYADNGIYTVALTVEDDEGAVGADSLVVTVNNVAPLADAGGDREVLEGAPVIFEGNFTDPGADIHSIQWDFGDGSTASGTLTPMYVYPDNGVYTVTLTVIDDDGGAGSDIITVTVKNAAPVVQAGSDLRSNEGDIVNFSGSFSDSGTEDTHTVSWDFGDGSPSVGGSLAPTHIYADDGLYAVTLTVTDKDGGVGTDTLTVTVDNVIPTVEAGDDLTATEGDALGFSATFSDPGEDTHAITWHFGDGSTTSGTLTPTHYYGDNGTYTVTVTVTDDDGGAGTDTCTVTVANAAPVITGISTDSPSNGEINLSVAFEDSGWLDSHTGTFIFGDGSEAEGTLHDEQHQWPGAGGTITGTHNYATEGLYTIRLWVTDDDGSSSAEQSAAVSIDKTLPVITISEPKAGNYYNTHDMTIDFEIDDPVSNGVASGIVENSVTATLDDETIETGRLIDLSMLEGGAHNFKVSACDYAGNCFEQEVVFEVGPLPALVYNIPHRWDLNWSDPFENIGDKNLKNAITAYISLENAEVETILPTFDAGILKTGRGYGNFVIVEVLAAQLGTSIGFEKVRSITLKYVGEDEIDVLAFSGEAVWDFYDLNPGAVFTIDAGENLHLSRYTTLSSYISDPPLYSSADIIPATIRLNGRVPIIEGSARLIAKDPSALDQSRVMAEPPYTIVKEKRHYVWMTIPGLPQQITLTVGDQTIFEDEPYPIEWHDWFSLEEDGQLQTLRIHVSATDNKLRVFHHNLQEEARIYLDGALALTILPEVKLVVLSVDFNPFEAISTVPAEVLERGGDWLVTTDNGVNLQEKHSRKQITVTDIGNPNAAKLMVGDTVIFDNIPFPIKWSDRYFLVDGERQDLSIRTITTKKKRSYLSIRCKRLTREARLYLDDQLVLSISPPPEVEMVIAGNLELDGDPTTFDGSFRGSDEVELNGKLPKNFDPARTYQRINTSGEPMLQVGDRFGDFDLVSFDKNYDEWRKSILEFTYEGNGEPEIKVYEDPGRKHLIDTYQAYPGSYFSIEVGNLNSDQVYLEIGNQHKAVDLTGKKAAEIGDSFLDCIVVDLSRIPLGPPNYMNLILEYSGTAGPISLTAYDERWQDMLGTYQVDPDVNPVFSIDASRMPKGYFGEYLVLEYGPVESSE